MNIVPALSLLFFHELIDTGDRSSVIIVQCVQIRPALLLQMIVHLDLTDRRILLRAADVAIVFQPV